MLADQRFPHLCRLPRLRIALSGRLAHQACRLRGPHLPLLGWIEARIKVIQLVQDPVWICICVLPSGCAALLQHPGSNWSNRVGAPGACRPAGAVRALPPATPAALCPVAGPAACLRGSSVSGGSWPRAVAPVVHSPHAGLTAPRCSVQPIRTKRCSHVTYFVRCAQLRTRLIFQRRAAAGIGGDSRERVAGRCVAG